MTLFGKNVQNLLYKEQKAQQRKSINVAGEIGKGVGEIVQCKETGRV